MTAAPPPARLIGLAERTCPAGLRALAPTLAPVRPSHKGVRQKPCAPALRPSGAPILAAPVPSCPRVGCGALPRPRVSR